MVKFLALFDHRPHPYREPVRFRSDFSPILTARYRRLGQGLAPFLPTLLRPSDFGSCPLTCARRLGAKRCPALARPPGRVGILGRLDCAPSPSRDKTAPFPPRFCATTAGIFVSRSRLVTFGNLGPVRCSGNSSLVRLIESPAELTCGTCSFLGEWITFRAHQGGLKSEMLPFGGVEHMPRRAIKMGVGSILECRRCVLLATGEEEVDIIAKAIEGPITAMVSATTLQLHQRCTVVVDERAASKLQGVD
jgi:hypothetical protein